MAALVRPRPSGPRLPSCQVGRQKCACGSPAPILSRPPGAGLQRVSWGPPLHHLSDSPSCSVPDYHLYLPAAPGPGQSFVGGRERPDGSEMGRVGDTGHPSHPYKEKCTRPPSATGSFSVPSTQSDSTLETKELPHLIYGPRMYTIQSPPDPDHSQHTTDTGPSFTADHGLYVCTQDTPPHTVDGLCDVPGTHTLPQAPSTCLYVGWTAPNLNLNAEVHPLSMVCPMDIPAPSVPTLWQVSPSVHPSVGVHNGHLQPPGIFPATTAGLSPAYCPAGP